MGKPYLHASGPLTGLIYPSFGKLHMSLCRKRGQTLDMDWTWIGERAWSFRRELYGRRIAKPRYLAGRRSEQEDILQRRLPWLQCEYGFSTAGNLTVLRGSRSRMVILRLSK